MRVEISYNFPNKNGSARLADARKLDVVTRYLSTPSANCGCQIRFGNFFPLSSRTWNETRKPFAVNWNDWLVKYTLTHRHSVTHKSTEKKNNLRSRSKSPWSKQLIDCLHRAAVLIKSFYLAVFSILAFASCAYPRNLLPHKWMNGRIKTISILHALVQFASFPNSFAIRIG